MQPEPADWTMCENMVEGNSYLELMRVTPENE